jgi:hypothetical protein
VANSGIFHVRCTGLERRRTGSRIAGIWVRGCGAREDLKTHLPFAK